MIIPVYNVGEYLRDCLDSLIAQSLTSMELIIIDDGSNDGSTDIVAEYARRDDRFVLLNQDHRGPGAARNYGISVARARYITFLDADDTIPKTAYRRMVDTLDRTGSDFVLGAVRRVHNGRRSTPAWTRNVHAAERLKITIDDFPEAMQDVIACNRMLRRDFWTGKIGRFPEGVAYEDHVPMVTAYIRARSFDILTDVTYNWRIRENATSMGQQKHRVKNLYDRLNAKQEAFRIVSGEASDEVKAAWLGRVISTDLPVFVPSALVSDDQYRSALQNAAREFLSLSGPEVLQHARADRKLLTALVAEGDWAEVDRLAEYVRLNGILPQTEPREDRILARLPFGLDLDLPASYYELSVHQSKLMAVISGLRWESDRCLRLEGWAYIRGIDLTDRDPVTHVWLQRLDTDTETVIPLTVQHTASSEPTLAANDPNQRYDRSAAVFTLSSAELPQSGRWQLRVQVEVDGIRRQGAFHDLTRFGNYDRLPSSPSTNSSDQARIVPVLDDADGLVFETRRDRFQALELHSEHGKVLHALVAQRDESGSLPVSAQLVDRRRTIPLAIAHVDDRRIACTLTLPDEGSAFSFQIVTQDGRSHRVAWPCESDGRVAVRSPGELAGWSRTPRGLAQVTRADAECQVLALSAMDGELQLRVAAEKVSTQDLSDIVLSSQSCTVAPSDVAQDDDGTWALTFPLTVTEWGGTRAWPLPTGTYSLSLPGAGGEVPVTAAPSLLEQVPLELPSASHAVSLVRGRRPLQVKLRLAAPLQVEERGKTAQRQLATTYQTTDFGVAEQVFFQCFRGATADDHQLAIHEQLRRQRSDLELVWGIADRSVQVPSGGRGIVVGSSAWYEALGRSRYLCVNADLDRFFRRRKHQRVLQTFSGHPFKSMGTALWRNQGYTDRAIAAECERRAEAWSAILASNEECVTLYRDEYRYGGDVIAQGSPRIDRLINATAAEREQARQRLGIPAGNTVVLYAPTWRDADATGEWTARTFDEIDLQRLSQALGPDHTILFRGHPYTIAGSDPRAMGRKGVLDVTRHPNVNELMLAADVAVMDYSSLRFDWLTMEKPIVFFVPDREDFFARRPPLGEFEETAPGPLLRTTDEVIETLRALPSVAREFSDARDQANRRFNPLEDGSATARVVSTFFGSGS